MRDGTLEENETNRQKIDNMMKMMTDAYEKMQQLREQTQTLKVDLVTCMLDPNQLHVINEAEQQCRAAEQQLRDTDHPQ